MRRYLLRALLIISVAAPMLAQTESAKVEIRAILVDKDLNQKPVPFLSISLEPANSATTGSLGIKTGLDGTAEGDLPPGKCSLQTDAPIEFQGKRYSWSLDIVVNAPVTSITLSNDNATVTEVETQTPAPAPTPGRVVDDLTTFYQRYQNSVVTVWSEFGHGTGFLIDKSGIFLTNQHVVGPSNYIAIQFDEKRKLPATLLAFDAEKDIAVLWADLSLIPEAVVAPLPPLESSEPPVVEGERVFTIGSPLHQMKIITTGIASRVEPHAIISDISINHGNSGGPLFNSQGVVVGLTTFKDPDESGPGISGIVRIEDARLLIERAKAKMQDAKPPAATLLPVEPVGIYPIDALKVSSRVEKFDYRPYTFTAGNFDVAVITPVLQYQLEMGASVRAEKEKEKRNGHSGEAVQGTFRPLDDLKNWGEYVGEYSPVIMIRAVPELRETFGSALRRSVEASSVGYTQAAKMRFKTDFYRMKLLCGSREVQPIQPGKIASVIDVQNAFVNVTDATYEGFYLYPYDSISTSCGKVTLQLFSEKNPGEPIVHTLDDRTVARVEEDFKPYKLAQIQLAPGGTGPQ
jgi:S1-C subfamily serine protease